MIFLSHISDPKRLQTTPLSRRYYRPVRALVTGLRAEPAEPGGNDGGARIAFDHSTLNHGVIRMVPLLDKAFRRHKRSVGRRWHMDETYIKIKGQWRYLYRAVDTDGQTIDFLLTAKRDAAAALRFFHNAIRHHGEPNVVTIDKSGADTAALTILNAGKADEETIIVRQSKYLNNLVEQDHRNIKRRIRQMQGFQSLRCAQTILAGIELMHMIRKVQLQHSASDGLSPAEQFYLLAA